MKSYKYDGFCDFERERDSVAKTRSGENTARRLPRALPSGSAATFAAIKTCSALNLHSTDTRDECPPR